MFPHLAKKAKAEKLTLHRLVWPART